MSAIVDYVNGISKATFCHPKLMQKYVSLEHFVSLQPRECMFVKDAFTPDGMIVDKYIYLWFPTPDKGKNKQIEYAEVARKRILELIAEKPDFEEVIIDVRNNIGGVLSTFINATLPLFIGNSKFLDPEGIYMYGIDCNGKTEAKFVVDGDRHRIMLSDGESLDDDLISIGDIEKAAFIGKKMHVLCNKYTMSSGEIMCIIARKLGHTLYGEPTRGLTNGCRILSSDTVKSVLIPYYTISDGKIVYKHGIKPDKSEADILKYVK